MRQKIVEFAAVCQFRMAQLYNQRVLFADLLAYMSEQDLLNTYVYDLGFSLEDVEQFHKDGTINITDLEGNNIQTTEAM